MWHTHVGNGHYFCRQCGQGVYARSGGCRNCGIPLAELMLFDDAYAGGMMNGPVSFDPFDDSIAFNIPGTDLAIEPDGQLDLNIGGFDIPL